MRKAAILSQSHPSMCLIHDYVSSSGIKFLNQFTLNHGSRLDMIFVFDGLSYKKTFENSEALQPVNHVTEENGDNNFLCYMVILPVTVL